MLAPNDALRTLTLVKIPASVVSTMPNSRSVLRVAVAAEERRMASSAGISRPRKDDDKKLDVKI